MTLPEVGPVGVPVSRTAALLERVARLEAAVAAVDRRVPAETTTSVRRALATVSERLALGVDHTVVALVGGTGSGKSSLFNALSGLEFADVGVRRPTTSQVSACVWAHDASALLDWLGISHDRRIDRESALDGESQADLRGLVLLDLPDHDSVEPAHREVVDRLLPLADLLVWVVDPQKYADDALHTGYLKRLTGHDAAMLVVVNQVDTVPTHATANLLDDVARLLQSDGLPGVPVHGVSARTGDGVRDLREVLAGHVGDRTLAEVRAAAELDDAARLLGAALGASEAGAQDLPRDAAVDTLATAAGLASAVGVVEAGVASGRAARAHVEPVQRDRVAGLRARWVDAASAGLPGAWRTAVEGVLPDHRALSAAVDDALSAVPIVGRRAPATTALRVLTGALGLAGLVALGLAVAALTGDDGERALVLGAAGLGALVLAALVLLGGRRAARSAARREASRVDAEARETIGRVVDERLVEPVVAVLGVHRQAREAATVTGRASTGRHTGGPSTG